jgi:hypothetical protein
MHFHSMGMHQQHNPTYANCDTIPTLNYKKTQTNITKMFIPTQFITFFSSLAVLSFAVSGNGHEFGEILTTNQKAGSTLNKLSSALVGKSISNFLLPPLSTMLFKIVNEFLETGISPYMYKPLIAYMGEPEDCFQVQLRFVPFTPDGMEYTIYTEFATTPMQFPCYLLCTAAGELIGMTSTCRVLMEDMSQEVRSATFF